MKKSLAFVVLTGLLLTGCGGKQMSAPSAATPSISAAAAVEGSISVPGLVGMTLDKATNQLQDLGLKVKATDVDNGKSIVVKSNWTVASQGTAEGTKVNKGATVELGVHHLTDSTPTPTPTPTPVKVVEAPPAPVVPAAPPAVAEPPAPAYVPPAPAYVPPAPVQAPPVYGGIICKDGYAWPGTTRQGACHGHGGIRN
ncbi:PASTA domain-containing protein [Arthrobacter sp. BPSS-3]|uniref:PASTA domain-containing protein n=1 Tax=Arthrobacter sp. BPSS-3 TaxID=3366580 RepID=UPI0037DC7344